ncbi:hypothetical protein KAX02_02880 [candidate division WOR-3 bacterium]|nr:hypothetical protein [candidate division WOR-3 bacterium]
MNTDFRVAVSFSQHPKTKKLMRKLGRGAIYSLINLWSFIAMNKPDGIMTNMDIDDIEIASDWDGECSKFVLALLELKFIDKIGDVYNIHDWKDHNGYAFYSPQRSEKAKNAAKTRWKKKNKTNKLMLNDANSISQASASNAPSPNPSPNPKKNMSDSIEYRLANYLLKFILNRNPKHKKPNIQSWAKHIDLMLRIDNHQVEDIRAVIKWCQIDSFWQNNILSTKKLREKFDQLYLKMQEFNPKTGSWQTDANLRAAKAFLEDDTNGN